MLVVVGISSYAAETTWKSQPTNAAGYDSALEGSSSTTTKIPTGWWIDKTANTKWDLTAKYASGGYYSRGTNGLTFGSGNAAIQTVTLETSAFSGTKCNHQWCIYKCKFIQKRECNRNCYGWDRNIYSNYFLQQHCNS